MELRDWCQSVHTRALHHSDFLDYYVEADPSIRSVISGFSGVKSEVHRDMGEEWQTILSVSLILSDFTSFYPRSSESQQVKLVSPDDPMSPRRITLPTGFLDLLEFDGQRPQISPSYFCPVGDRMTAVLRELQPLARAGRLMVRPTPMLIGPMKNPRSPNVLSLLAMAAEPDLPEETWVAKDESQRQSAMVLKEGGFDPSQETQLFSFTMPYLDGLTFKQLAKVLRGEADCLAEFRQNVSKVLDEVCADPSASRDTLNDLVRPATDKIERRFKSIASAYRIECGGMAVAAAATLTLTALTDAGVATAVGKMLGVSGLGVVAKRYADYLKEKAALKDMPFYLLWRLRRG